MAGEERQAGSVPATSATAPRSLSAKLLLFTVLFVMSAEVLIFLPSIANYKRRWLDEHLASAAALSVVLAESNARTLSRDAQRDALAAIGAKAIAVRGAGVSRLFAVTDMPPEVDEHVDLAALGPVAGIPGALDTLAFGGDRILRVFGPVGEGEASYELIMPDGRLRKGMLVYSRNVALVSLLVSLVAAVFVYQSLNRMMIRPVRRLTRSMLAFAEAPDDPGRIIRPQEGRTDELGLAERELAAMQTRLQRMLAEQKHLADLGLAVSKINHEMRNILASAQLLSDRLRGVNDPAVQAFAPKLLRALDRAVAYSEGVLAYGRAQEAPPSRRRLRLRQLTEEVVELLGIDPQSRIEVLNTVDPALEVEADADQLFRILTNLCRNAVQAMAGDEDQAVVRQLAIAAERRGSVARILVTDSGPGLPQRARENLFSAFRGSARSGGTGLGLAVAQELARAHGGDIELLESRGGRTVFCVTIPDQPINLSEAARAPLRRPA